MKRNIKIISLIIALFCIAFLANCDGTRFQGLKNTSSPAGGSGNGGGKPGEGGNGGGNLPDDPIPFLQEHPEIQAGKKVQVCIAYALPARGHSCDSAKFDLFFNDETESHSLNLDNAAMRSVTTISGNTVNVGYGAQVPGTLYDTVWQKDGSIATLLKCKAGQHWMGYKCHIGTAVISIIGEVELSDGSTKYLATELVQFQTQEEATRSFSYTGVTDGETIGDVKFHLSDTKYEFDDYCGFKK